MLRRALAILVLVLVAVVAIRIAVGHVVGLVSAVPWILVIAALVATGAVGPVGAEVRQAPSRRQAAVDDADRIGSRTDRGPSRVEMRRITEQGRR